MDARDKRGHDEQIVGPGEGRTMMRKALVAFANFAAAVLAVTSAQAQQTVKIGLILAYSGQFADPSAQMDNGIKPYMVRTSFTVPQLNQTLGTWAYKNGIRKAYTMVSDFGPGHDGEVAFHKGFKDAGGEITGAVRYPVANQDFAAFVQRAKDANADAIYIWTPGGPQPAAIGKALAERGVEPKKTKVLGQGELTSEDALKNMGEAGLGIITAFHYDYNHQSANNSAFVKAYKETFGRNPDMFSAGAFDGMHVIYEALKKTGGKTDGESLIEAAKGMRWESPRGPMSIDPETRDVIQTVYIRRVEKIVGA